MKIEVDYENYVFDINRDSEERRALFEKEYQKVVEVNNRVNAANKWKKKNVITEKQNVFLEMRSMILRKQYVGNNIFYFIYIKLKYAHCN